MARRVCLGLVLVAAILLVAAPSALAKKRRKSQAELEEVTHKVCSCLSAICVHAVPWIVCVCLAYFGRSSQRFLLCTMQVFFDVEIGGKPAGKHVDMASTDLACSTMQSCHVAKLSHSSNV